MLFGDIHRSPWLLSRELKPAPLTYPCPSYSIFKVAHSDLGFTSSPIQSTPTPGKLHLWMEISYKHVILLPLMYNNQDLTITSVTLKVTFYSWKTQRKEVWTLLWLVGLGWLIYKSMRPNAPGKRGNSGLLVVTHTHTHTHTHTP